MSARTVEDVMRMLEERAKSFDQCAHDLGQRGYGEPATSGYRTLAGVLREIAEDIRRGPVAP